MPILPGKKETWQSMMNKINEEPMRSKIRASRDNAGVHERTFLQETPAGDFVVITLEGDNPAESFAKMMADPSMADFMEFAKDVHGMDPNAKPALPKLVFDSKS